MRIISPKLLKLSWTTDIRGGGGVYSFCNRDDNKKWFLINSKDHNYFILTYNPIIMVKSMVYTENYPITLNHHRNTIISNEVGRTQDNPSLGLI